jgi:hypothetical protein
MVPPDVPATSTASLIAMPSDPVDSGSASRIALPACVVGDGDGTTSAPNVSMKIRRYGFCSYDALTMKTWHSIPKNLDAIARADPHCPAPVSVARRFVPASLL